MPSDVNPTFKLSWRLEDFVASSFLVNNFEASPSTGLIPLYGLGWTKWQIDLCPRTEEGWIACSFARNPKNDEEVDMSFLYTIRVLEGQDQERWSVTDTALSCDPFTSTLISIIPTEEVSRECLLDDHLRLEIVVRRLKSERPVDVTRSFWKDELKNLSTDMRKLLESRYRSDFKLVAEDGCRILTHAFMLSARWPGLAEILREEPDKTRFTFRNVSSSILTTFVRYLYTGEIKASDLTTELFDFIMEQKANERDRFHTLFTDMSIRTRQVKDHLAFTCFLSDYDEEIVDFFRVLPLKNQEQVDLLVEISTDLMDCPKLIVVFSLHNVSPPQLIHLRCSVTLLVNDKQAANFSNTRVLNSSESWRLPDSVSTSLLTVGPAARRRIEFDLEISKKLSVTHVEKTVTEFHTGSLDLKNFLLLSNELFVCFSGQALHSRIFDVAFRTGVVDFYSSGAVLGVRSTSLRRDIPRRGQGGDCIVFDYRDSNAQTVASLLEYIHSGWVVVRTRDDAVLIYNLAEKLNLLGLMEKCEECRRIFDSRVEH